MMRRKKLILKKRRRLAFLLLLLIAICVTIGSCFYPKKAETVSYDEYIVRRGDTLWDIAKMYSGNSTDVRKVIREIEDTNNISDALIYSGDTLLIPTNYCED